VDNGFSHNRVFRRCGAGRSDLEACTADFDRVSTQLAQIRIFRRKLVAYAYWPYMQADLNADANRLNSAYADFVEETIEANLKVLPE
jgi:hypothetical protein